PYPNHRSLIPGFAELFLKTHDLVFASRPKFLAAEYMSYGQKNLGAAPYGQYWRNIRKLCTLELLSNSKVEFFKSMRREDLVNFVESLRTTAQDGSLIDISAKVESLINDVMYRMVVGLKDDRFKLKPNIQEGVSLTHVHGFSNELISDGRTGLGRRMKAVSKMVDELLDKIIEEHLSDAKEVQGTHMDFIDVMLSLIEANDSRKLHLGRDHVKAITLDMLAAGMHTSSTTVEWVIAELLKHPRVMKLVQEELQRVVGLDRMVEETDFIKLDYMKMVIKETMRLHPVAPLLIPHESIDDITIKGYFIPKKSRVLINTWAIGRDPNVWSSNAEEFYPERFIGTNIDFQGHDFRFLPFGSGRRKCPGIQLGLKVVELVISQLVHCFNLELPDNMSPDDLDMTEKFGIALSRANHLMVVPTYRLLANL
ncbi:hypothetical protein IFM89_038929, partial [Coptis chinensis]